MRKNPCLWLPFEDGVGYKCSVCDKPLPHADEYEYTTPFCPYCGTRMNDEEDDDT